VNGFRVFAVEPVGKTGSGYRPLGFDKSLVTKRGAAVRLEGVAGAGDIRVVSHDDRRRLLATKHAGYTAYTDRGSGNLYTPARFVIYEYDEAVAGNEIHLFVGLFGIMTLPISWKPEHERGRE